MHVPCERKERERAGFKSPWLAFQLNDFEMIKCLCQDPLTKASAWRREVEEAKKLVFCFRLPKSDDLTSSTYPETQVAAPLLILGKWMRDVEFNILIITTLVGLRGILWTGDYCHRKFMLLHFEQLCQTQHKKKRRRTKKSEESVCIRKGFGELSFPDMMMHASC